MICHEANAAYCRAIGDLSQPSWESAPEWQKDSAIDGVHFHLANPDAGDSASHDNWMAMKLREGWVYGTIKDPIAKTHHCLVPFDQLPPEQQAKDRLFRAIVHALVPPVAAAATPEMTRIAPASEVEIEREIQAKGLTALRLTPDLIEATITGEHYHVVPNTVLTVCVLTLRNGFNVVGHSAPASPENFDKALGEKIARQKAREQIWALEGYLLRQRLYTQAQQDAPRGGA